jgi:hypothetical protein
MSFSLSSRDITLDPSGQTLRATCQNAVGNWGPSQIDLDAFIGNIDGNFQWGSSGYSQSAQSPHLSGDHTLVAELRKEDGSLVSPELDLNRHIANSNGVLTFNVRPFLSHAYSLSNPHIVGSIQ